MGITFGRPAPKIWKGEKNRPKFSTIFDNFRIDREYLRNDSRYPKSERNVFDSDSSRVPGKKSGELWSTNKKVLLARIEPPKCIFGETIFQPLGGAAP